MSIGYTIKISLNVLNGYVLTPQQRRDRYLGMGKNHLGE